MNLGQMRPAIVIDAREFAPGRPTGIGRVLQGLMDALLLAAEEYRLTLCVLSRDGVPERFRENEKINILALPKGFLLEEKRLARLASSSGQLFISPYRKLPLTNIGCPCINTVHDILDLNHELYRKRVRRWLSLFGLKRALRRADITWYDSIESLRETCRTLGSAGKDPRVRYLGIDCRFSEKRNPSDSRVLQKYELEPGYILVVGNGAPHKNLGVLLDQATELPRTLIFVGISRDRCKQWTSRFPHSNARWIEHAPDDDFPALMRSAFCLAQPSTAEGYGYPPLEAMACGVPAVVSQIPVLVETTGGKAITADPSVPGKWREAFQTLENRDVYYTQIARGLKWVEHLKGPKAWHGHLRDIAELILWR